MSKTRTRDTRMTPEYVYKKQIRVYKYTRMVMSLHLKVQTHSYVSKFLY